MFCSKRNFTAALSASLLIGAIVVPINAQANQTSFKDVNANAHYYDAVASLQERGIIQGYPDGTFKPTNKVTRGQAAKIIANVVGLDTEQVKDPGFKDLPTSDTYYKPIAALVEAGVLNGYEDETFRPYSPLTRGQMAKILHKAFGLQDVEVKNSPFTDIKHDDWYANYIESLRLHNITTGTTATTYSPRSFVTRGHLASFVIRSEKATSLSNLETIKIAGNNTFSYIDGKASMSAFRSPTSLTTLQDGSILITDRLNHRIRKLEDGNVSTFAGLTFDQDEFGIPQGEFYDSNKDTAMFHEPSGITVDEAGNVYIADSLNHAIRKISEDGQVTTIAGNGFIGAEDGTGEQATFYLPQAVAVTGDGVLYIADTLNHLIRKIEKDGTVRTLNSPSERVVEVVPGEVEVAGDFQDGSLKNAKFNEPSGLVVDSKGNLYVSDSGNQLIRYIDFSTNTVSTVAGNVKGVTSNSLYETGGLQDGAALQATFNFPKGLALLKDDSLVIVDSMNKSIRYLRNGKVETIAQGFNRPTDVAVDKDGGIFIADSDHHAVYQLK